MLLLEDGDRCDRADWLARSSLLDEGGSLLRGRSPQIPQRGQLLLTIETGTLDLGIVVAQLLAPDDHRKLLALLGDLLDGTSAHALPLGVVWLVHGVRIVRFPNVRKPVLMLLIDQLKRVALPRVE